MTDEHIAGKGVDFFALIAPQSCEFTTGRSFMVVLSYLGTGMMEVGKLITSPFSIMMPSFE